MNKTDHKILHALTYEPMTKPQLSRASKITQKTLAKHLPYLIALRLVAHAGVLQPPPKGGYPAQLYRRIGTDLPPLTPTGSGHSNGSIGRPLPDKPVVVRLTKCDTPPVPCTLVGLVAQMRK